MNKEFMKIALKEAMVSEKMNEIPVGAVIVKDNEIISVAHNLVETLKDPTAHAEVIAIKKASKALGNWRLSGCDMYVTLEPCPMCTGAIIQSRISRVYIGTFNSISGCCGSVLNIAQSEALNSIVDIKWLYDEQCSSVLTKFFKKKR
ncbi:MAG: nucleoside deaminase [Clostridium lundense]|nr:nucleoside deaminase [Clostridium lundense]